MEDGAETITEEELYEGGDPDFEDGAETNQIDEVLETLKYDYQVGIHPDTEIISGVEAGKGTRETAEEEPNSEGILSKLPENNSANSVPPEVVREFGAGQWGKTYEERGEAVFNFQTGEMMSKDGSISLTKQIRESAGGQHAALHEQVVKGWMETSGGAQLIAFNENLKEEVMVHVTRTWIEQDGQIASETWSKAVPKAEALPQHIGFVGPESLVEDLDDYDLPLSQAITTFATAPDFRSRDQDVVMAESTGKTEAAAAENSGIELRYADNRLADSKKESGTDIQAKAETLPYPGLLPAENLLILEQSADFEPSVEIDDFDDDAQPIEKNALANDAKISVQKSKPDVRLLTLPTAAEISAKRQEQKEPIQSAQTAADIIEISPEGISFLENLPDADDDIEFPIGKSVETQTLQLESTITIKPAEVLSDAALTEILGNETGIELVVLNDNSVNLEEDAMPKTEVPIMLKNAQSEHPQVNKRMETTGISLLVESEIQAAALTQLEIAGDKGAPSPVMIVEAALPGQDILKPEVLKQELSGIEIDEIAQTVKAVENNTPKVNTIKAELSKTVINESRAEARESISKIAAAEAIGLESSSPAITITMQIPKPAESPANTAAAEAYRQGVEAPTVFQPRLGAEGITLMKEMEDIPDNNKAGFANKPAMLKTGEIKDRSVAEKTGRTNIKNSGIKIAAIPTSRPIEQKNESAQNTIEREFRQVKTIESQREARQAKPVEIQTVMPKPEISKPRRDTAEAFTKVLEIKPEVKQSAPIANPVEVKAVQNKNSEKSNHISQTEPAQRVIRPTAKKDPITNTPPFRVEQRFNIAGSETGVQKSNQEKFQASSGNPLAINLQDRQSSKPIVVKFSQKNPAPFKPAELINTILTFKPAVIAGADESANNTLETYMPEFELAA